jgi:hypothetical protein
MSDENAKKFFADLERIRPNYAGGGRNAGVQEVVTTIPVRKPRRLEFIRTSRDPAMWRETTVFVDEQDRNETYYVPPEMRGELLGATKDVTLVLTATAQRVVMVWPLTLPMDDGRRNHWTESAREGAERAKDRWIRVVPDMSLGAYQIYQAVGAETPDPTWPEMSPNDVLELAFKGRVIDTPDHPIVRRLRSPT